MELRLLGNKLIIGTILVLDVSDLAAGRQRGRLRISLDHMLLELERFLSHRTGIIPGRRFVVLG